MPDYDNLAMIQGGVISLDPVIGSLYGLTIQQLGDESIMTQFDFVAEGRRWYPIVESSPPLQRYQSYNNDTMLSFDAAALVVRSVRSVRDWDAAEILTFKQTTTRHISKLAFRNRFTQPEKIAFEMAQTDDPAATLDLRQAAAGVRVMEKDLAVSQYADLNDVTLQVALGQLEALGVLGAGRADEIIWGDIEPDEVP